MPEEGSVEVDGEGFEDEGVEESTNENSEDSKHIDNQDDSKEESTEKETEEEGEKSQESEEGKEEEGRGEEGKTEKGTRLDPDPLSQANQLRANAEAKLKDYDEFFSDPKKVESYLADLKKETVVDGEEEDEDLIDDPSKIETTEDLQSYAKFLDKKVERAIGGITGYVNKSEAQKERENTVSNIVSDTKAVQAAYSELRPTNADGTPNEEFDEELEAELGAMIHELDFDPNIKNADGSMGNYRGKVSYKRLADRFMKAARRGETNGSKKAQTVIKDRRTGKIKGSSSGGDNQPDESNMSASQMIAARMQRARARR